MRCSVIIPACDEEAVLPRLLDCLVDPSHAGDLEVVVVCNGCTDRTEAVARAHPIGARVLSLAEGSKHLALEAGDRAATVLPRLYVDADIEITAADIEKLALALDAPGTLAVAPSRLLDLTGAAWPVRAYYAVWEHLPAASNGLFGRGVIGVSAEGYARIGDRPDLMGDDLFLHSLFSESERRVVTAATSVVFAPRTVGDLLRRRVRATRGNAEFRRLYPALLESSAPSPWRELGVLLERRPALLPHVAVFILVTMASRLLSRRQAHRDVWLRDESSRALGRDRA